MIGKDFLKFKAELVEPGSQINRKGAFMEISKAERRKYGRVRLETVVDIKSVDGKGQFIAKGRVKDLSLGGLKLESCHELNPKDVIIGFSRGFLLWKIKIRGRVAWVSKERLTYSYGIEFRDLSLIEKAGIWLKKAI